MKLSVPLVFLNALLGTFLTGCGPAPIANDEVPTTTGADVYRLRCAVCHQPNGSGLPGGSPPLAGSAFVNGLKDPLIAGVLLGMKGPQSINGRVHNGVMPSWKDNLSAAEIANVLTFLRSSWGNASEKITAEEVEQVRRKVETRSLFPSPGEIQNGK